MWPGRVGQPVHGTPVAGRTLTGPPPAPPPASTSPCPTPSAWPLRRTPSSLCSTTADNRCSSAAAPGWRPPAQRLALTARDRGCTRPGCPAPPAWCEVHHLTEWQHGGGTDITNLALVCPYDHHLITDTGYTVRLGDPVRPGETARVEWTAPAHLDPTRQPRTNPLHHPPDLTDTRPPHTAHRRVA